MRTKISWILLLLSILFTETKAQIIREKQRDIFGSPAKACGLSIDSRKSKQEEFSVYDASELRSNESRHSLSLATRVISSRLKAIRTS